MSERRLVLASSPVVGPLAVQPLVAALGAAGIDAVTPFAHTAIDRYIEAGAASSPEGPFVLVGYSAGGSRLYAVAERIRPTALIFMDARLPADGVAPDAEQPFRELLDSLPLDGGMLPPWPSWWPDGVIESLCPDVALRERFVEECPAVPRSMFSTPVPAPPVDLPSAFLAFGEVYADQLAIAEQRGWPVAELPLNHLAPMVAPGDVAAALGRTVREPGRLVTGLPRRVAVIGPTASGKSSVAMAVAESAGDVELVSVDSMQVYRGMDIGTAKPTDAERARVRHHLIDLVEPTQEFSVAEFQRAYRLAIVDIAARRHRSILVGGTGLYHRAVIDELDMPGEWPELRRRFTDEVESQGPEQLHARLAEIDPVAAERIEPTNARRIVRALEVCEGSGRPFSSFGPGLDAYPPTPITQVGLRWDRAALADRIERRVHRMIDQGLVAEVTDLAESGLSRTAAQALGYKEILAHLRGELSLDEALALVIVRTAPVRCSPGALVPPRPPRPVGRRRARPGRRGDPGRARRLGLTAVSPDVRSVRSRRRRGPRRRPSRRRRWRACRPRRPSPSAVRPRRGRGR